MPTRRGFTYLELMVVMTIIALLMAIAVPNFLEAKVRARVSTVKAELALVKMGIEAYRLEYRAYPVNAQPGVADGWDLIVLTTPVAYMPRLPIDPFTFDRDGNRLPESVPYRYFNGLQTDPEAGVRFTDPFFGGFTAAVVWSIGPDKDFLFGRATRTRTAASRPIQSGPDTQVLSTGELEIAIYDPTNGSISNGDIYRTMP